ncbi:hypothetical protein [Cetobacterium sp.]|uniref:hypothetical protein n=1 Tax=Cetobacterium sp. TaxID=2071632 RepID=UPI003F3FE512
MVKINVEDIEKLNEAQKKNGTYNVMLSFCLVVAMTTVGTIIWQNTVALRKISEELSRGREDSNYLKVKLESIEKKIDILFLEKYDIKQKK